MYEKLFEKFFSWDHHFSRVLFFILNGLYSKKYSSRCFFGHYIHKIILFLIELNTVKLCLLLVIVYFLNFN